MAEEAKSENDTAVAREVNFEQLPLARPQVPAMPEGQYRVYSDATSYKLVQALSAIGALEASGMQQAVKIERESSLKNIIINPVFARNNPPPTEASAESQTT